VTIRRAAGDTVGSQDEAARAAAPVGDAMPALRAAVRSAWRTYGPYAVIAIATFIAALAYLAFSGPDPRTAFAIAPGDAGYIPAAYARNLALHFTVGYQPGGEVSTAPGMAWIVLLATVYRAFWWVPGDPVIIAKLLGALLLFAAGAGAYRIACRVTGRRWLSLASGLFIVLDPHVAFSAVSGLEHPLFLAAVLWTVVFRFEGRHTAAGAAAAVATGVWPIGGIFFLAYLAHVLLTDGREPFKVYAMADPRTPRNVDPATLRALRQLAAVPAAVFVVVGLLTIAADGGVLPGSFGLAAHPFRPFDAAAIGGLLTGFVGRYSPFSTPLLVVGLALLVIGISRIRSALGSLALLLAPVGLVYWYLLTAWRDLPLANFTYGQLVDIAYPLLLLPIAVGWIHLMDRARHAEIARLVDFGGPLFAKWAPLMGAGALGLTTLIAWPTDWHDLPAVYQRSAIAERHLVVEPAKWAAANLPEDATVAVMEAGATRIYMEDQRLVDLLWGHSPAAFRRPLTSVTFADLGINYVLAWDETGVRSVPELVHMQGFEGERAGVFPGERMAVWETLTSVPEADPSLPFGPVTAGFRVLDEFDIGDVDSETAHGYTSGPLRGVHDWISRTADGRKLTETLSLQPVDGADDFTMHTPAGQPALLLVRYDSTRPGTIRVFVDGVSIGRVVLYPGEMTASEIAIPLPGNLIVGDATRLRVTYEEGGRGELAVTHYWTLASPPDLATRGPITRTPEPGSNVLASDSFEDPSGLQAGLHFLDVAAIPIHWETEYGEWQIIDGMMSEGWGQNRDARVLVPASEHAVIEADLEWHDGPAGITFWYRDPSNWAAFYFFPDVPGFSEMRLGTMRNGAWAAVGSGSLDWGPPGTSHRIGVRMNADGTVSGLVDDRPAGLLKADPPAGEARAGLFSRGSGNRFDNFVVLGSP